MILNLGSSLSRYVRNGLQETVRYKNTHKTARKRNQQDAGVRLRAQLFQNEAPEDLDDFDNLESDFMNVGQSHRQHEDEVELQKEKIKHLIVQRKYFKTNTPNFLTWSDKQQIKYLHSTNPEEWCVDKLSDGFPALPGAIAKIIKGNWTKKNTNKIKNHDNSVQSNWNLFKEQKLTDLPQEVVEHLNKFTDRRLNFEPFEMYEDKKENNDNLVVGGEFSEIMMSYNRIKEKNLEADDRFTPDTNDRSTSNMSVSQIKPKKEMYLAMPSDGSKKQKEVTLKHLQSKLESDVRSGRHVDEDDKLMLSQIKESREITSVNSENPIVDITDSKYAKTGPLSSSVQSKKDYSHLSYPEKITIPKDKLKRGCTYKLNDCFYDCNGWFLYRVPGMDK